MSAGKKRLNDKGSGMVINRLVSVCYSLSRPLSVAVDLPCQQLVHVATKSHIQM